MAVRRPTARSLVLDLLSTLRGGSMPVSALVAAGALFGIGENPVRVAVARLRASGRLERDERGRYRLGAGAEPVDRQVRAWRRLEERLRRWDGAWIGVHGAAPARAGRRLRAGRERALRLLGFEGLEPSLALRPDNLRGGVAGVREVLRALGLEPRALVFRIDALEPAADRRARALWDAEALRGAYAATAAELAASEARLPHRSAEAAMVESFLLGGRAIRQLALDPLLPEPIVPAAERRALVDATLRYDRAGRRAWAPFLQRFGAPHARTPAATGMAEAAASLGTAS